MEDPTEDARRLLQAVVNADLSEPEGESWDTERLQKDFSVQGFMAPFVIVTRKSDGKKGTLLFRHSPRVYYQFEEASF